MSRQAGHVPVVETLQAAWAFFRAHVAALAPAALGLAGVSMLIWMVAPLPGGAPPPAGALPLFPAWAVFAPILMIAAQAQGMGAPVDPLAALLLVGAGAVMATGY